MTVRSGPSPRRLLWVNRVVLTFGLRLPVFPRKRTSSEPVGMSQTRRQTQTWRVEVAQKKKPPEGGSKFATAHLEIRRPSATRVSLQLEELLQERLNVLMGFGRRRFLVVAARKPFFIARIAW
jgi:hypothetical protein